MSYILDALKKSQQEREAQSQQEAFKAQQNQTSSSSLMPLVWLMVLVVGLVAMLFLWVNSNPQAILTEPDSLIETKEKSSVFNRLENKPNHKYRSVVPKSAGSNSPEARVQASDSVIAPSASVVKVERRTMPPLSSLKRIPTLIISSHIYSAIPEKRSLTMNKRMWREGDSIVDGVIIEEITTTGLRLSVDGWPLSISRQQGWQAISDGN